MKDPIFTIDGGRIVTTSSAIADACGVQHASVRLTIRKYQREINRVQAPTELKAREIKATGEMGGEIVLDEWQALLIVSLMRNSPMVARFKEKLILELFKHRETLSRLGAEVAGPGQALAWLLRGSEADSGSNQCAK